MQVSGMKELTMNEIEQVNGGFFGAYFLIGVQVYNIYQTFK